MNIAAWLRGLGLERYEKAFKENNVDVDVLPKLTADDLKEIGVIPVGDRRRLIEAIDSLPRSTPQLRAGDRDIGDDPSQSKSSDAERRQLTVLFCDLVGSTALSARLDPEDLAGIIRIYQACCAEVVGRWGGHIAKYLGDGVLVFFGYPQAHEDDAERAVRAGLELAEKIAQLSTEDGTPLSARSGIATGVVMVGELIGEGSAQEETVVGETPNLAARLQGLAKPGAVVISPTTRRLVGDLFELTDLDGHELKGFADPIRVWQVVGDRGMANRFEALRGLGELPLIGRDEEFSLLLSRWERARAGEGQLVLLSGEPGIGKSRLVQALLDHLADQVLIRLRYYASPYHTNSALYPIITQLERAAGITLDDATTIKLEKLEAVLGRACQHVAEVMPLIAALLSIPYQERYSPLNMTPQAQRAQTFKALLEQLEGLASVQPVLMVFEDAHWMDPTTADLFASINDCTQRLPILAIITHRPEFQPPWTRHAHALQLSLSRLVQRHGRELIQAATGSITLPQEVVSQIVAKTDGVPLFLEELTKSMLESGPVTDAGGNYELDGDLHNIAIPATLHDSLLARLDRHASVKEVAQIGAVIGREFSHSLLALVAIDWRDRLDEALDQLVAAELISRRDSATDVIYTFKHALVQDAAYQSLLKSKRQELHGQIAQMLVETFPEIVNTEPDLVAHHYTEAGIADRAALHFQIAGERAVRRCANVEAIAYLSSGLKLLTKLPAGMERDQTELDLLLALGAAQSSAYGYSYQKVRTTYNRARELCLGIDDRKRLFNVLICLRASYMVRGELRLALRAARDAHELAKRSPEPMLTIAARSGLGQVLSGLGKIACAKAVLKSGIDVDANTQGSPALWATPIDQRVNCRVWLARTLAIAGFPKKAAALADEAVTMADEGSHRATLALVLSIASMTHLIVGNATNAVRYGKRATKLAHEQGLKYFVSNAQKSWALAQVLQGNGNEGIDELKEGLVAERGLGDRWGSVRGQVFLAEALDFVGRYDEALGALDEFFPIAHASGVKDYLAEAHRLRGEVILKLADTRIEESEHCFLTAIDVARAQRARWWELSASVSLARLWHQQGKKNQARCLLDPIYQWFTEGFETPKLKDAKALLGGLQR